MRVLVGGVGYRFLRDGSVGPWLADTLQNAEDDRRQTTDDSVEDLSSVVCRLWSAVDPQLEIEIEDLSYHPVGLTQNLQERPPYDRLVLVAAVARGRPPGTVEAYRWDGALPPVAEIQDRVAEAVTGVISLDNLLVVCGALGGLPDDVRVVEIEPADQGWGEGFSPPVQARLDDVVEAVWTSTRP